MLLVQVAILLVLVLLVVVEDIIIPLDPLAHLAKVLLVEIMQPHTLVVAVVVPVVLVVMEMMVDMVVLENKFL